MVVWSWPGVDHTATLGGAQYSPSAAQPSNSENISESKVTNGPKYIQDFL